LAVPKEVIPWVSRTLRALLIEDRSDILVASREDLRYSAGFMMIRTAAVRIAKIPMTTNSSTRVKESLLFVWETRGCMRKI